MKYLHTLDRKETLCHFNVYFAQYLVNIIFLSFQSTRILTIICMVVAHPISLVNHHTGWNRNSKPWKLKDLYPTKMWCKILVWEMAVLEVKNVDAITRHGHCHGAIMNTTLGMSSENGYHKTYMNRKAMTEIFNH